ncbi:Crp/Fnr family transcriptional regulator [Amorphus sp. 3PC139-8]|uniref:Crp/Fnr family transcriptional regulator n=1 Tax=Amorphus sp. 3PC139-8 TaxID=2735676 RepID=UPI00345C9A4A
MSLSRDIAVMRKTPMLAGLEEEHLRLLAFSSETRRLERGELLFDLHTPTIGAGVIASGSLSVASSEESSRRSRLLGPGGIVNGLALLLEGRPSVRAVAQEPSEVIVVGRAQFRKILTEYPETARDLEARIAQNLRSMAEDLEGVRARLLDQGDAGSK